MILFPQKNMVLDVGNMLNAGKKVICVNLKHPKGVEIVKKLSSKTDILLEPFRPGNISFIC